MEKDFESLTVLQGAQNSPEAQRTELTECNGYTEEMGLVLSGSDIAELIETKREALIKNGRTEFKGGIFRELIRGFADSPYIMQENYALELGRLTEVFYYFRGEFSRRTGDRELIELLRRAYDGAAGGDTEYLFSLSAEELMKYGRGGNI